MRVIYQLINRDVDRYTLVVEAVAAHDAFIDTENVAARNLIGVSFVSQIANPHVLRVRLVFVSFGSVTGVETHLISSFIYFLNNQLINKILC